MTADEQSIREDIHRLVAEELNWNDPIPSGRLSDKLDSMQLLSLSVAIEDHYEICFEPEEEAETHTFDDLLALIQKKLSLKNDA